MCTLVLVAFVLHKHILFSIQADPYDMPENHFGKLLSPPVNILEVLIRQVYAFEMKVL